MTMQKLIQVKQQEKFLKKAIGKNKINNIDNCNFLMFFSLNNKTKLGNI